MKIADFKRDAENKIIALDAEGNETPLDFGYVAEHKPQIGDDYPTVEETSELPKPVEEITTSVEEPTTLVEEPAAPAA
jgi:hypothetical protein